MDKPTRRRPLIGQEKLSKRPEPALVPVFNIEVEDFHTYYVGGDYGFWVHDQLAARVIDPS